MKQYYIYIMSSTKGGAIYIGVTGNLIKRVHQHLEGLVDGFS